MATEKEIEEARGFNTGLRMYLFDAMMHEHGEGRSIDGNEALGALAALIVQISMCGSAWPKGAGGDLYERIGDFISHSIEEANYLMCTQVLGVLVSLSNDIDRLGFGPAVS